MTDKSFFKVTQKVIMSRTKTSTTESYNIHKTIRQFSPKKSIIIIAYIHEEEHDAKGNNSKILKAFK